MICPIDRDNEWKHWLIPDSLVGSQLQGKVLSGPLREESAAHQLVGEVKAHQGEDG